MLSYDELEALKTQAATVDAPAARRAQSDYLARCAAGHNVHVAMAARERALRMIVSGDLSTASNY